MKFLSPITFTLLLCAASALWAQPKFNSPYSRYGLGDPARRFFAAQAGYGGQTAAFHDHYHLNPFNPASYAFLRTATFEGGAYAKYGAYQSPSASQQVWTGNMAYVSLGFPLRNAINDILDRQRSPWHYGTGLVLMPHTSVGYNVSIPDSLPDLGNFLSEFKGDGGTYRLSWGHALRYKQTAIGIDLGWLFGRATYESSTAFRDSFPTFISTRRDDQNISGFVWKAGMQHDIVLKYFESDTTLPQEWITLGASGGTQRQISSTADRLFVRHRGRQANGQYSSADTLLAESGRRYALTLPAAWRVGAQYVRANKLRLGAEFAWEGWSVFENAARSNDADFRNIIELAAGVEYIPDHISYNRYLKRVRYRFGAHYRQDPRLVGPGQLDDIGLSFGMGFPLILPRQQTSFVQTSLEVGRLGRGTSIQETYARITLGFTFNDDSWFFKRRFD
ncbi:MAG: hypothetical protein RMJ33_05200 [Saprospiraceae bacterium]|nr:hypothetical protein [Saprospiraceae bacterium]MDW8229218.1 hypothetical protein [Saprospiraceae bacterium]